MMGSTHVSMAMIGGLVTLPLASWAGLSAPVEQAAWVLTWAGFGLAPDFDHPNAHAARMWGFPSRVLALGVGRLAGGHRKGTHDLVLSPLIFAVLIFAGLRVGGQYVAMAVLAITIGLALRGLQAIDLGRTAQAANLAISLAGAWWLTSHDHLAHFALLPLAAAGGVLCHLIGDGMTDEKLPVPILWLFGRQERFGLALMATGKRVESLAWAPTVMLVLVWLLARATDIHSLSDLRRAGEHILVSAIDQAPTLIAGIWQIAQALS